MGEDTRAGVASRVGAGALEQGRVFPGKKTWGAMHGHWLRAQRFEHPARQFVLHVMLLAARHAEERLARVEAAIAEAVPSWSLAPVVETSQALRGAKLVTAATVRRLGVTKAGNGRVRQAPVESAWCHRHAPRTGRAKHYVHERVPAAVRDIAAKVQARLCARYRALLGRGLKPTVAVTAIAREPAGFVWAIGREVQAETA